MPEPAADLVLTNGVVYTADPARRIAAAVAITGQAITFVGDARAAAAHIGPGTRALDLEGRLVLPAFVDSHCHVLSGVCELYEALLHGLDSLEACRGAIARFRATHPDLAALRGAGWSNALFGPDGPTAALLDDLAPEIPAVLDSEDGHSAWVNTRALALAGLSRATPDPAGGLIERDAAGNPSGTLREAAMQLVEGVIPPYSSSQLLEGLQAFQRMAHALGITTAYIPDLPRGSSPELEALQAFEASSGMALRLPAAVEVAPADDPAEAAAELAAMRRRQGEGRIRILGAKVFMDGVVESATAYLESDYEHLPGRRGVLLWEPARFKALCAALDAAGLQIHVHSIGDAATRHTLDGLAHARARNGARDSRHAITHLQLVNPEDIERFAALGAVAVPQPYWFVVDAYYRQALRYLGPARADRQYPMRAFFERGVVVASASDYPVTRPPNPLEAIEIGVTRTLPAGSTGRIEGDRSQALVPAERVRLEQMIDSFTTLGAQACFLERQTGSLEPGKRADLVVLDRNILALPPEHIHTASVVLTLFEGREVYRAGDWGG